MQDLFWSTHLSFSETARRLGMSRQNVHQCVNRGSFPSSVDASGKRGVPIEFVNAEYEKRFKTREIADVNGG